ncbi:hypothetical protein N0V90_002243 [Kalmusia sp. IMI 367209]|nr:hypothetical protein N0V90_002243 [Kalmusia sp. IMI 367209]
MANPRSTTSADVPQYVLDHAPIVHLFSADPYRPSSPVASLVNTRPQIAFEDVQVYVKPLKLGNLDQLNGAGAKGGVDVYLTSVADVTTNPAWLNRTQTDVNGGTLGDHVGDWEHNMIRFVNGSPKAVWYSQHANGSAYTFSTVLKDTSGKRPLAYCVNGSHALYPTPGTHDHTIPNINLTTSLLLVDETDQGPLYDPLRSAYYYTYTSNLKSFTAITPSEEAPTGWLYYKGRWSDEEYPASDKS